MSSKIPRTQDDLKRLLFEQIAFLELSADAYDRGLIGEAKRLAVTLRLLLHQTKSSISLLGQLGLENTSFVDTALPNEHGNVLSYGGLVSIGFNPISGIKKYVAPLDNAISSKSIEFQEWWTQPVFKDAQGRQLSRRDLVLTAANQDGGAHVDPSLDERYLRLATGDFMGWYAGDAHSGKLLERAEAAAIRQIAHEVLRTLKPEYEKPGPQDMITLSGVAITISDQPAPIPVSNRPAPIPPRNSRVAKVGRNQPCPCGSGKKYKRCHGHWGA
jgi:hypothetical protein